MDTVTYIIPYASHLTEITLSEKQTSAFLYEFILANCYHKEVKLFYRSLNSGIQVFLRYYLE